MAFPNTLFPCIPLNTDVSDEEYRLFHAIDINLIKTLIRRLGRDHLDAMNVVAFLMWLERSRLSVNAVYKLGNLYWPDHLLGRLADQVVALLGWLTNPSLVWEMRGDISLIEELCDREVDFVELHRRRLEILEEKRKIVHEMCQRAFEDKFGGDQLENDNGGIAAGPANDPQELQNNNYNGVGAGISGSSFYDPGEPVNGYYNGAEFRNASGFAGGPVHNSRELMVDKNYNRTGMPCGGEPMNKSVVRYGAGPVDPRELHYYYHNGAGIPFGVISMHNPRALDINHNEVGFGTTSGLVHDHREYKNMNGVHRFSKGPIFPDVAVGPRMERNMRRSEGHEIGSSGGSMAKNLGRRPLSEYVLSILLPGLNISEEETHVHFDDRTIFLTFSKGHPVTESELWNFFTRRFGNFIKRIYFEEVPNGVQPLYARMVTLNTSILPLICDVHIRTKYIINGRHVWARKYVRKN